MAIGVAVHIGAYAVIEALVPERGITVEFDDRAYVGHFLRLTSVGGVRIGADAMLSDRVYVSDTSHIYEDVTRPIKVQGLRDGRSVDIGDGCLGRHRRRHLRQRPHRPQRGGRRQRGGRATTSPTAPSWPATRPWWSAATTATPGTGPPTRSTDPPPTRFGAPFSR